MIKENMELISEEEKTPQFYSVDQTEQRNIQFGAVADICMSKK